MDKNNIRELDEYSKRKAGEVFGSLPYTPASEQEFLEFAARRARSRRITLGSAIRFAANAAAVLFIPLLVLSGYLLYNSKAPLPFHPTEVAQYHPNVVSTPEPTYIAGQQESWIEYVINPGVKGKITLPDSSEVWVNSKSSIKCPAQFDSRERRVQLSGEAYFKVKSNKNWPMRIETNQGVTAMVLGTEFNMTAYEDDPSVTLSLVKGKVELHKSSKSGEVTRIALEPMESVQVYNDLAIGADKTEMDDISLNNVSAWRDGYLVFANTPMSEVVKIMERWYGVKFNPIDEQISRFKFTARFRTESLTQILDLLGISSNIKYSIKENTVTLYR